MRKFIKKVLLYLLIPSIYIGANFLLNTQILKTAIPNVKPAKVLILGDSHFRRAMNPTYFQSAINVSQQGEPYVASFWKLKKLQPIVQPDTVFIAFSPYNIGIVNDLKFTNPMWATMMFERYYSILDVKDLENVDVNFKTHYRVLLNEIGLFPSREPINYIGEFVHEDDGINRTHNFQGVIDRHFYQDGKELGISETSVTYLDSLIQFCEKRNIEPILIGTPVHQSYYNLIPKTVQKQFSIEKKRLENSDITIIDKTADFYPDSCYLDADHLNNKGMKVFMEMLKLKLQKPPVSKEKRLKDN